PCALKPMDQQILNEKYDLVVLGYQVWYLSPSIPFNSFLQSDEAKRLLRSTPVGTVINCRNMWVKAQEKVKKALHELGAQHVGNRALVDRQLNHISGITIVHWMMKGRKDSYLGIFPNPGVSEEDIMGSVKFGRSLL